MKIVAMLGVKDEVELIRPCIDHLRSIGVDLIVACDSGSADGTRDLLDACGPSDDLQIVDLDLPHDQKRAKKLALARDAQADWVMFLDADEFWLPRDGALKSCRGLADADVLVVERFNVPPTPQGPPIGAHLSPAGYDQLLLCIQKIPAFHATWTRHLDVPWLLGADILPKVLARTDVIRAVNAGGHTVEPSRGALQQVRARDLLIAHVPFSTFPRFERKVANIRNRLCTHPEFFADNTAWHWQRWASLSEAGRLREEFERQLLDEGQIARLRETGVIGTAAAWFAQSRD